MIQTLERTKGTSQGFLPKDKILGYTYTNETLEAVVRGLALTGSERVLAIGPDQGFALLEDAGEVTVVDVNTYTIHVLSQRKKLLQQGDIHGFLSYDSPNETRTSNVRARNDYFTKPERLNKIRSKLTDLHIVGPADVVHYAVQNPGFDRIYVSNALGDFLYYGEKLTTDALGNISEGLASDSLLYVTYHTGYQVTSPPHLLEDLEMTMVAKALEQKQSWNPVVYKKITDR